MIYAGEQQARGPPEPSRGGSTKPLIRQICMSAGDHYGSHINGTPVFFLSFPSSFFFPPLSLEQNTEQEGGRFQRTFWRGRWSNVFLPGSPGAPREAGGDSEGDYEPVSLARLQLNSVLRPTRKALRGWGLCVWHATADITDETMI